MGRTDSTRASSQSSVFPKKHFGVGSGGGKHVYIKVKWLYHRIESISGQWWNGRLQTKFCVGASLLGLCVQFLQEDAVRSRGARCSEP